MEAYESMHPGPLETLDAAGFDVSQERPGEFEQSEEEEAGVLRWVVARSWGLAETARYLGTTSRQVREMLAERRLYGFRYRGSWQIPDFQFQSGAVLPGIDQVVGALSPELGPVSVTQFATTSNEELLFGDRAFTPLEWLAAGYDPEPAVRIAKYLLCG